MGQDVIGHRFLEESVFAIADGYCVINLTKNVVPGVMYQVVDGKKYNLNEQLGLPENSSLQSLVDAWALTIPEEGRQDFLKEFNRGRLLERFEMGERHISFRYWTRTATFEPMLAEDHMALYRDEESGDVIAVNYVLDRTEHYRLEEKERALEKSNREYAKLLEEEKGHTAMIRKLTEELQNELDRFSVSIPGGVKISNDDPEYSFKYVSEQFANMLGYATAEELIEASGGNIVGLVHPDDFAVGLADALDQYAHSDHYATIYRMRCKDGSYKYIEDRGRKVVMPDGTIEHWNLMLDKNDFMVKSVALESEKRANKSKSAFLSRMSHDMRTPLNGILGLLKIDENHFDDINLIRENHKKMQISADYLLSLINEVLQMSKIEDGNVPLTRENIDFADLTNDILTIMEQRAKEQGIQIQFKRKRKEFLYPFVYGSPVHLRQIFLNIYGNCIKYNHPGGTITTVSDYTDAVDGVTTYEWTITDTGIGMSKEFLEHIFDPFVQEKNDARSIYQGIGLGMAIVKGLIDEMGGTVEVESEEGVGSTFVIRIPFQIASVPASVKEQNLEAKLDGMRLLLAEDNELNAEIAKTLLSDEGAEMTVVDDGLQAVELFRQKPEGYFDAILMDIMMPVMDGLTATKTIRGLHRPDAKTIPIIAMTANAFTEDAEKCLEAGMNAHVAKPFRLEKVKRIICEQVRK